MKLIPRGVANNNPGNLVRNTADKWQGVSAPSKQVDPRFWNFDDAVYGIRAIARQLIAYQDQHGCRTVAENIARYAPPKDNNPTSAYATNVALHIGVGKDEQVNWHQYVFLRPAIEAIIEQENGGAWTNWYTEAQLTKACVLAGVEPPKKSLVASKQMIGSAVAATATVAAPIVQQVQEQLQPLTDYSEWIKKAFLVVALLGIVLAMWAKIDERRKGIS